MPREGHGSRNRIDSKVIFVETVVMPREGHGSRNACTVTSVFVAWSCPARGMGVEIFVIAQAARSYKSCPARGMGVEIYE